VFFEAQIVYFYEQKTTAVPAVYEESMGGTAREWR
jgi:hypothetical protein